RTRLEQLGSRARGIACVHWLRGLVSTSPGLALHAVRRGWLRLARSYWGKGFATEAAKGSLRVAFERLNLDEVVSFTSVINWPSRAVMERIGMANTGEDFDHPALPEGSELRRHCLYKIARAQRRSSGALARG